jgi:FkbM family methyltransferase
MCLKYFDEKELKRWFDDDGDNTHRINYDINEKSIVLDIGGYTGHWSEKIHEKYKCKIHIYEPVNEYFNKICYKFKQNNNIKVYNYGASNKNTNTFITHNEASSSLFIEGNSREKIELKDINLIIDELLVEKIDLIKINIEGSEYELLESISDYNIYKVKNFQIQFHKIGDNFEEKRNSIRSRLSKTHKITYNYEFVWENWEKI